MTALLVILVASLVASFWWIRKSEECREKLRAMKERASERARKNGGRA